MATTKLSDAMLRTMLAALLQRRSDDGRYEVFASARTTLALETRGKVEREEYRDNNGDIVARFYLTAQGVTVVRNGLVLMMGNTRESAPTAPHRAFVRSGRREAEAAARLILGDDVTGAKVVTTSRMERSAHTEHLSAEDTVSQLASILSNGQRVDEQYTGLNGTEPAERLVVHLGAGVGAVADFHLKRPTAEDRVRASHERAEGLVTGGEGNYLITKEDRGHVSHVIVRRADVVSLVGSAIMLGADVAEEDGMVTVSYEPGVHCVAARTFDDGAEVVVNQGTPNEFTGTVVRPARSGCFRVREPQHGTASDYPAEELRTVKEARTPLACRTGLCEHAHEGKPCPAPAVEVEDVEHRMYVGFLRDGAADMGTVRANNVRNSITNGWAEKGHRAERLDDGTIRVGYSWFVPVPQDAADRLGEGERWLRHWERDGDSAVIPVDREGALNIVTMAVRHGGWKITPADEGGLRLESPEEGGSVYWLEPVAEGGPQAAEGAVADPQEPASAPAGPSTLLDASEEAAAALAKTLVPQGASVVSERTQDRAPQQETLDREEAVSMVAALLRAGGRYTTGPGELVVRAQGETLRLWAAVGAAAPQDEEATPVDEMGTDELLEVLREHAPQLPAGSPFAEAWAAMDHLLTAGGIECLPAPWDGHALAPVASTDAEAARAANTAARFTAQDDADPDSHPYVTLGDGGDGEILVGTRIEDGRLDLFVDLDTMDAEGPFLRPEDGTMPIVLRVNGQVVYRA